MRIAIVLNVFPAVSETFILSQITGLLDRGHDVTLFAFERGKGTKEHPDVAGYSLMRRVRYTPTIPRRKLARAIKGVALAAASGRSALPLLRRRDSREGGAGRGLPFLYRAVPWIRERKFDVVHCHFGYNGAVAVALRDSGLLHDAPIVTTFHGYDVSSYLRIRGPDGYRRLFQSGDLFLPISERIKHELITMGCSDRRIEVHHMGIDVRRFPFQERRLDGARTIRILSVGRLVEKKGFEFGIIAVQKALAAGFDLEYTIVGEGPRRSKLEHQIAAGHLDSRVKLAGPKDQSEVGTLLERAHLFLAPSVTAENGDQEGIPVSIMEAMSAGLPVVATRHGGIPELVLDGASGLLAPERDGEAIGARIRELASQPQKWPSMGKRGRARIESDFNSERLNDRLVEIYRELSNHRGPAT